MSKDARPGQRGQGVADLAPAVLLHLHGQVGRGAEADPLGVHLDREPADHALVEQAFHPGVDVRAGDVDGRGVDTPGGEVEVR